ncbi:MFS transporter [Amycolatopsis sp. NPDC049253]|uniref:MFS transporter n=1 Tax=Amycolatopsis sp. NPDC049253 TaxID=3155274 RepID=UPI00343B8458
MRSRPPTAPKVQHSSGSRCTSSTAWQATVVSFPAGSWSDRIGPLVITVGGAGAFLLAYRVFAVPGPTLVVLTLAFALAGIGIGCAETAEHAAVAALAPEELRGSAFGMLATVQALDRRTWPYSTSMLLSTAVRKPFYYLPISKLSTVEHPTAAHR